MRMYITWRQELECGQSELRGDVNTLILAALGECCEILSSVRALLSTLFWTVVG